MVKFFRNLLWGFIPKKVYGLVGAAGSGKSFRAFLVADKYNIDYIIDDGLLIKDQKIIAGKSAKRENLRVRAVKRAIFYETKHAREVRKKLYKEKYSSVLIIGTSERMILKIVKRLHLPKPAKIIKIEDISSEDEIKRAQRTRKKHGKHVMPIPLIEVKKKYPNIILHAIQFFIDEPKGFFFFKKRNKKRLVEKTIVRPNYGDNGKISISETALVQMVSHCIDEYSKYIKLKKVLVTESESEYFLKLNVALDYRFENTDIIKEIQNVIITKIEQFTKIKIKKVDIIIEEVTHLN